LAVEAFAAVADAVAGAGVADEAVVVAAPADAKEAAAEGLDSTVAVVA
jgi:hypothetical protein